MSKFKNVEIKLAKIKQKQALTDIEYSQRVIID